jgi:hypothetical protein
MPFYYAQLRSSVTGKKLLNHGTKQARILKTIINTRGKFKVSNMNALIMLTQGR